MTDSRALAKAISASPQFTRVVTVSIIATSFFAELIQRVIGWPGMVAVVATLVALAACSFWARAKEINWFAAVPLSLLIFLGWAALSLVWSTYRWATFGGALYLIAFTVLALQVALLRDTIQIVRSFGDALRAVLGLSIVLEVISGVFIDSPLVFLGIEGRITALGPVQGVMGTRNQLGLVAVLALTTFVIEMVTRSVPRPLAIASMAAAIALLLLSRSPVAGGLVIALGVAVTAIVVIRSQPPERRAIWQWGTLAVAAGLAVALWLLRTPVITLLSANSELTYRLRVWQRLGVLIPFNSLEGWGWLGPWQPDILPFTLFTGPREPASAVNAYLDVWFQLGLVGIFIFLILVSLAFVRSWMLAGQRRNVVFIWPALVLTLLLVSALAESSILVEYGWLTFVVCCVKSAIELGWRTALTTSEQRSGDRGGGPPAVS